MLTLPRAVTLLITAPLNRDERQAGTSGAETLRHLDAGAPGGRRGRPPPTSRTSKHTRSGMIVSVVLRGEHHHLSVRRVTGPRSTRKDLTPAGPGPGGSASLMPGGALPGIRLGVEAGQRCRLDEYGFARVACGPHC